MTNRLCLHHRRGTECGKQGHGVAKILAFAASLLLAGCVRPHVDASAALPARNTGDALVAAFDRFCLASFPADPISDSAASIQLRPLAASVVRTRLRIAEGRGWIGHTPAGDMVVTIEDSPVKACAVRRLYEQVPPFQAMYEQRIRQWARRTLHAPLQDGPSVENTIDGAHISGTTKLVRPSDGRPLETVMALLTRYPDHSVELRLVHQRARSASASAE